MSKSQSTFIQSLFRIDPTQGLVEFVGANKPYHTKILDVLTEYVYAEDLNVTFTERWSWVMEFSRPDVQTVYSCGYGFVWDPLLSLSTPDSLLQPLIVIDATPAIPAPSPGYENSNSFLIQPASYLPFVVAVVSDGNNQFVFAENYDITGVNAALKRWFVDDPGNTLVGQLTTLPLPKTIFVSSDTGPTGNGQYTVASASHLLGTTTVTVVEAIPVQAVGDGVFHRPFEYDELPQWPAGQGVELADAGGTLPTPVVAGTGYYFQPTATPGRFNLSYKRYPFEYADFVNLSDIGEGTFTVQRDESLVPGALINVKNTSFHRDDGQFIVKDVVADGLNERIFVYQKLNGSTNGVITFADIGYDEPTYCNVAQASDVFIGAFMSESLKFEFQFDFADMVGTTLDENAITGYGASAYGDGLFGPYGMYAENFWSRTAVTSGNHYMSNTDNAHTLLPTGIDTQFFDVGGIDETLQTVKHFYGQDVPL